MALVKGTRDPRAKLPSAVSNITTFGLAYKTASMFFPELDPMFVSAIAVGAQQGISAFGHALRDAKFFQPDKHKEGSLRDVASTFGARILG